MLTLRAPHRLFSLDALELLAHGGMVSWNIVTTRRPLLGGEYTFLVLDKRIDVGYTTRERTRQVEVTHWYHV
jgi:hypothetical protein